MNRDETTSIGLDDDRIKFFADRLLEVARIRAAAEPSDGESDKEDLASYAIEVVTLRRTALDALARLEDAKAAQALLVERAAGHVGQALDALTSGSFDTSDPRIEALAEYADAIRALAPASGVAALVALRADISSYQEQMKIWHDKLEASDAERDDALTRLAAAEAQVGALTKERDQWQEEVGKCIMACRPGPEGFRTSPASTGVYKMRQALDAVEAALASAAGGGQMTEAQAQWRGPGEKPHEYSPDYMAMGDCRICGHTREAHNQTKPAGLAALATREQGSGKEA